MVREAVLFIRERNFGIFSYLFIVANNIKFKLSDIVVVIFELLLSHADKLVLIKHCPCRVRIYRYVPEGLATKRTRKSYTRLICKISKLFTVAYTG
jgi:hypothetical protein